MPIFTAAKWVNPKLWLKVVFQAWMMAVMRISLEGAQTEVVRLRNKVGKASESLWAMKKEELVEKERKDVGMTTTQLEKETVASLRERLRSQRDVTEMLCDPLAKAPKGLDSMLKEELKQECLHRDITEPNPCTRPKMIVLIKDDVARRLCAEPSHAQASTFQECDEDAEMVEFSSTRRRS
jgi:hypothetical protein